MTLPKIPVHDFGGEGPRLHFAHANAYTPGCYRQLFKHLTPRYHVVAMEQRPLWSQEPPESVTGWHDFADDLITCFDQQGWREVIGVGHSLGGIATMIAAAQRPDLFRALVFIDPVLFPPDFEGMLREQFGITDFEQAPVVQGARRRRERWESRAAAFQHFRPKRVFQLFSDEALWDYVNYGLREDANGEVYTAMSRDWEAHVYLTSAPNVWPELSQITLPMMGLRAEHSNTLFLDAWEHWATVHPQAHLLQMAGVTHLLPMEIPEQVAAAIYHFLATL